MRTYVLFVIRSASLLTAAVVLVAPVYGQVKPLANLGTLDPKWNPVIPGGLTQKHLQKLKQAGWKVGTVTSTKAGAMLFASSELPGGYSVWNVKTPLGSKFVYNPHNGIAASQGCGNPTCWRWMVDDAPGMVNEGTYDPLKVGVLPGGVSQADRARLIAMGWKVGVTTTLVKNVEIAAKSPEFVGKVLLREFNIPANMEYLYSEQDGRAILVAGGNATSWAALKGSTEW